jgi:hypothetical protein
MSPKFECLSWEDLEILNDGDGAPHSYRCPFSLFDIITIINTNEVFMCDHINNQKIKWGGGGASFPTLLISKFDRPSFKLC